jgi:hypothetical protein
MEETGQREWKPNKRQEEFLSLPDEIFEGFYGGAAGGGKSEILLALPVIRQFYLHPQFKGILFRRTYPQLEESLIPRSREFYKPLGGKYNDSKHLWTFPSGATIRFSYMDKDEDARDHDTAEYHYAGFDELTHFTEFMYRYVTSRVRTSIPALPAIVRSASNPGNIGHAWVRQRFVEPYPLGGKVVSEKLPNGRSNRRIFIPAKLSDNPYLTKLDPDYATRLQILPEVERRAKLEGDWWTYSGQVFTEFRVMRFPDEPVNAVHVIDEFEIPDWWPKILCIDWGFAHMTYAGILSISPDKRVFLTDELTFQKTYIAEWAAQVGQMFRRTPNVVFTVMDPSAWQKRGDEKSIQEQFTDYSGIVPQRADNDRIGGKLLLHDYLRWIPKNPSYVPPEGFSEKTFNDILRIFGTKRANQYLKSFEPEKPETNLPRFQVFRRCSEFIKCLPLLVYDDDTKEGKAEDVRKMDGDDPYDAVRYGIKAVHRYFSEVQYEAEKRAQHGSILDRFKETGDFNYLHRAMERFESKTRKSGAARLPDFRLHN